ncbi:oligoribonuclease [Gammaproteobacteria bacterium]|nr:oligoribonuclease [Gammaproteobacteria bacterium]|tara:strand:- start:45 stop:563 length:519 start_codon:yes stop_codon:yes gene_type:complete
MDLEMTGLDPEINVIIEIATVVTTASLDVVAEGPSLAILQPKESMDLMDDWNQEHHSASGLIDRIASDGVSEAEAEAMTLDFVSSYVDLGEAPLCGNSIWQDRRFLARYMPSLESYLHYRIIDVSTVKELAERWAPAVLDEVVKKGNHRALDDVLESIDELRHYRTHLFNVS